MDEFTEKTLDAVNIGNKIHNERKRQNLTLKSLSNMAGISISYLCDIEGGDSKAAAERLWNLSLVLDMSMDYLLDPAPVQRDAPDFMPVSRNQFKIFNRLARISEFEEIFGELMKIEEWTDKEKGQVLSLMRSINSSE